MHIQFRDPGMKPKVVELNGSSGGGTEILNIEAKQRNYTTAVLKLDDGTSTLTLYRAVGSERWQTDKPGPLER